MNWGDGSAPETYSPDDGPTHSYTYQPNIYTYTVGVTVTGTNSNGQSATFEFPQQDVNVVPQTPTDFSATVSSSDQIDLSWSDDSQITIRYTILVSANNGLSFSSLTNIQPTQFTYSASNLTPDTPYIFEIIANNGEQNSSAAFLTATAISSSLAVTSSSTVNENSPYTLTVSSTPHDNLSWPIAHWTLNWNDGTGGSTDDLETISGASGSSLPHSFPTGTSFVDVTITAVDTHNNTFQLPDKFVGVIPTAPSHLNATPVSSTEIDLSWTDNSNIETGYTILRSDNGGAYQIIGYADPNATTYDDTTADPGASYQYEVIANGTATSDGSVGSDGSGGTGGSGGSGDSGGSDGSGGSGDSDDSPPDSSGTPTTTPSGTPMASVDTGPTGSGTAIVTWTYQGNDDAGFEIEEEDQSTGENYHLISNAGPVDSSGQGSYLASGLTFEDTYLFRIRADHTDGTVSDYSGGEATPLGITAPNITASPQDYYGSYFIELDWQPAVSPAGLTATSYNLQWHGSGYVGQGWTTIPDPTSGMGFNVGQAQTGEFRLQAVFADGTMTDWGISNTAAEGGGLGVPVSASASAASDTEIDLTYSCNPQTANNSLVSYSILYAPYDAPAGSGTLINVPDLAPGATGTAQITGLTSGTRYDFLVSAAWHGQTQADEAGYGTANTDATTQGSPPTTAPAAPDTVWTTTKNGVPGLFVNWHNSSNNEAGYDIYRSDDGVSYTLIGSKGSDETTFYDPNAVYKVGYYYMVVAFVGAGGALAAPMPGDPTNPLQSGPATTQSDDSFFVRMKSRETEEEGDEATVYLDSKNNATIGIGHNLDAPGGNTAITNAGGNYDSLKAGTSSLTPAQIDAIFRADLIKAIKGAQSLCNFDQIPDDAKEVVVDLVFNFGTTGIRKFHDFLSDVNAKNWRQAAWDLGHHDRSKNSAPSIYAQELPDRAGRNIALLNGLADDAHEPPLWPPESTTQP